jgi:uncharacterized membrane protein
MPICARCTGFYAGLFVSIVLNVLWRVLVDLPSWALGLLIILGVLPMALDGLTQYYGIRKSNNTLRLMTGLGAGFIIGLCAVYVAINLYEWTR